jgi:hypothetical protein
MQIPEGLLDLFSPFGIKMQKREKSDAIILEITRGRSHRARHLRRPQTPSHHYLHEVETP